MSADHLGDLILEALDDDVMRVGLDRLHEIAAEEYEDAWRAACAETGESPPRLDASACAYDVASVLRQIISDHLDSEGADE